MTKLWWSYDDIAVNDKIVERCFIFIQILEKIAVDCKDGFLLLFFCLCVCVCECLSFSVWIEWKWVGIWKVIVLVDLNAHKWESSLDFYYFIKFLPSFFLCVLMNSQRDLIGIWISFVWLWFARGIIDYFEFTCDNLSSMKIFESPRAIAG